jgi:RND superfamily putative drug exporter
MATLLHRLGKTAYRRWPIFIAGWIVAMLAVGAFAATMSKPMTDAFSIPGIPSEKAADMQEELFPQSVDAFDRATVNVVDRKSTRLNSSHNSESRMPSSA